MTASKDHVVSGLIEKRRELAGIIDELQRQLDQHRADLTHIDGVLRVLATDLDPEQIRPKRIYRRNRYFARNELSRLCLSVLRTAAGEPLSTDDIADRVIATKSFDAGDAVLRTAIPLALSRPRISRSTAAVTRPAGDAISIGSAPRTRIATPFQLFCPCQIAPDQVERWPIDQLIPYAKNSRTHSEAQIAQLAASMKEWGWTNPVLADEAGGVIAGHARILAARQLGRLRQSDRPDRERQWHLIRKLERAVVAALRDLDATSSPMPELEERRCKGVAVDG